MQCQFSNRGVPVLSRCRFAGLLFLSMALGACSETENNVALGTLERDRIVLTATADEIITALPVAEGTLVRQGQLLVQLDPARQTMVVAALETEMKQHKAVLGRLQNGPREEDIKAARARLGVIEAQLKESIQQLQRVQQLVVREAASQSELDRAVGITDSLRASLEDAQAQLDLLVAGTRIEELQEAQARVANASARLALEQHALNELAIVATRDGLLETLPHHLGERVSKGTPIAILLDHNPPYAQVFIPEPYRASISTGQALNVRVDGIEEMFSGTVRWVATEPEFTPYYALNSHERSRLVYRTKVQLPTTAADLPAGLPAQVELAR